MVASSSPPRAQPGAPGALATTCVSAGAVLPRDVSASWTGPSGVTLRCRPGTVAYSQQSHIPRPSYGGLLRRERPSVSASGAYDLWFDWATLRFLPRPPRTADHFCQPSVLRFGVWLASVRSLRADHGAVGCSTALATRYPRHVSVAANAEQPVTAPL